VIEVEITEEMLILAKQRAKDLGVLRNSITSGQGNTAGYVGEIAVQKTLGGDIKDTFNYDIMFSDGVKADVKTKRCKSKPLPYYECSISNYNTSQKCEKYVFVRVLNDYSKAWILGSKDKKDYFEQSSFVKKGQLDPSNGWRAKCDCWNLPISSLESL
jgi:hypothetical protein